MKTTENEKKKNRQKVRKKFFKKSQKYSNNNKKIPIKAPCHFLQWFLTVRCRLVSFDFFLFFFLALVCLFLYHIFSFFIPRQPPVKHFSRFIFAFSSFHQNFFVMPSAIFHLSLLSSSLVFSRSHLYFQYNLRNIDLVSYFNCNDLHSNKQSKMAAEQLCCLTCIWRNQEKKPLLKS